MFYVLRVTDHHAVVGLEEGSFLLPIVNHLGQLHTVVTASTVSGERVLATDIDQVQRRELQLQKTSKDVTLAIT